MPITDSLKQKIEATLAKKPIVLFMKGNKSFPQCGFSAEVVRILGKHGAEFETVNVLADAEIRDGIKEYSSWPTIPQLYVRGEFVGGCDIVKELDARGELPGVLGVPAKPAAPVKPPTVTISEAAAKAFRDAAEPGGDVLRLEVGPRYEYDLAFGPVEKGDIVVQASGLALHLDPASAGRADGVSIDFVQGPAGAGFKITSPNEPARVKVLSAEELAAWMKAGEPLALFDVRSPKERDLAKIEGATLLDPAGQEKLEALPKDARIVFHCHHGMRSQAAAEAYLAKGYTNLYNLKGGIDAWSLTVDAKVPRY